MKSLFKFEQFKILNSVENVRRINGRLVLAQQIMRPLQFKDLNIRCLFSHIGSGVYTQGSNSNLHQHTHLQLEYALSGKFNFRIDDVDLYLNPGVGLFIPPEIPHIWNAIKEGVMLGVLLEVGGAKRNTLLRAMTRSNKKAKGPIGTHRAAVLAKDLFLRLSATQLPAGGIAEISAIFDLLNIELCRAQFNLLRWQPTAPASGSAANAILHTNNIADRAMQFIESNYMHSIQMRDVALHAGVSLRHVNRVFFARYQTTINKSLLRIRLDRAFQMLSEHPEYSIKAVAHDSGFSSAAYFSRCFSNAYGFSPLKAQGR